VPILILPTPTPTATPVPVPEAELQALEAEVNGATYADPNGAAAKQDLLNRVAAIRADIQNGRRIDARDKLAAFKGAVDDLKTANTIDATTATNLQQKADAVAAKV
jgi:hypothetical protein